MGDCGFKLCSVVTRVNFLLELQFRCFSYCLGTRYLLLSLSTSINYLVFVRSEVRFCFLFARGDIDSICVKDVPWACWSYCSPPWLNNIEDIICVSVTDVDLYFPSQFKVLLMYFCLQLDE